MPRNMSFALTADQIRDQTKTVTRRLGWLFLKPPELPELGDVLNACVKCQGLKSGEKIERICQIRVVNVRREPLEAIRLEPFGTAREGFPDLTASQFILMFMREMKCFPHTPVTRIEFEYMDGDE